MKNTFICKTLMGLVLVTALSGCSGSIDLTPIEGVDDTDGGGFGSTPIKTHDLTVDGVVLDGVYTARKLRETDDGAGVYQLRFSDKGDETYYDCDNLNVQLGEYSDFDSALWATVKEDLGVYFLIGGFSDDSLGNAIYTQRPFYDQYYVNGFYEIEDFNSYKIEGEIVQSSSSESFLVNKTNFIAYKCGDTASSTLVDVVNAKVPENIVVTSSSGAQGNVSLTFSYSAFSNLKISAVSSDQNTSSDWNFTEDSLWLQSGKLHKKCNPTSAFAYSNFGDFKDDKIAYDISSAGCRDSFSPSPMSFEMTAVGGVMSLKATGASGEVYTASWSID